MDKTDKNNLNQNDSLFGQKQAGSETFTQFTAFQEITAPDLSADQFVGDDNTLSKDLEALENSALSEWGQRHGKGEALVMGYDNPQPVIIDDTLPAFARFNQMRGQQVAEDGEDVPLVEDLTLQANVSSVLQFGGAVNDLLLDYQPFTPSNGNGAQPIDVPSFNVGFEIAGQRALPDFFLTDNELRTLVGDNTPPTANDDNGGDEASPPPEEPPVDSNIDVRISNQTRNGDTINDTHGVDLTAPSAYGVNKTVDYDTPTFRGDVTYNQADSNSFDMTLDSAWNSIKNVDVRSDQAANISLDNFVHADVALGDGGDSTVTLTDVKRGNITTGDGNDTISIDALTNGKGWSNAINVESGAGGDNITVNGDDDATIINVSAGADNDVVVATGDYDRANIDLGLGDDTFYAGKGRNTVAGGGGQDTFVITGDSGPITITDFTGVGGGGNGEAALLPEHDTLKLEGTGLTAENMLLSYDGSHTTISFDGIDGTEIVLENFDFTDLDNLSSNVGFNILFDGQESGSDVFDVANNHNSGNVSIWNRNSSSHLNNEDNSANGRNNSDDTINGMAGNDTLKGRAGDDTLRGQAGDDNLHGERGNDILKGGDGTDTAFFQGDLGDYSFSQQADGSLQVTDSQNNRDDTDYLYDIEQMAFADGTFAVDQVMLGAQGWIASLDDGNNADNVVSGTESVIDSVLNDSLNSGISQLDLPDPLFQQDITPL